MALPRWLSYAMGAASAVSLGYAGYRFLEGEDSNVPAALGVLLALGAIGARYFSDRQARQQQPGPQQDDTEPVQEDVVDLQGAMDQAEDDLPEEPQLVLVEEPEEVVIDDNPDPEVIKFSRSYWGNWLGDAHDRSFYRELNKLVRPDENGVLYPFVRQFLPGFDHREYDSVVDLFRSVIFSQEWAEDLDFTYGSLTDLLPEIVCPEGEQRRSTHHLTWMKDHLHWYLDDYVRNQRREGKVFQEGRLEFLIDLRESIDQVEAKYGEIYSGLRDAEEALSGNDQMISELETKILQTNVALIYALGETRTHLQRDGLGPNAYFRREDDSYSAKAGDIFNAYRLVNRLLDGGDDSISSYL